MPGITIQAHAKVNLALSVGPPEPEGGPNAGYHPICSWIHPIALADTVSVETLPDGAVSSVRVEWSDGTPVGWATGDDLAARAHAAVERATGRTLACTIRVRKSIPAGAGLGGGSADCAAVLVALDRLFGLGLGETVLHRIGVGLGSDVPFFIDAGREGPPRPAIVTGFGERIERIEPARADLTLVLPPYGCSTGSVYRAFDAAPGPVNEDAVRRAADSTVPSADLLFNDLADAACRTESRLGPARAQLGSELSAPVHITGSGSTMFLIGAFDTGLIERFLPGCDAVLTRLV